MSRGGRGVQEKVQGNGRKINRARRIVQRALSISRGIRKTTLGRTCSGERTIRGYAYAYRTRASARALIGDTWRSSLSGRRHTCLWRRGCDAGRFRWQHHIETLVRSNAAGFWRHALFGERSMDHRLDYSNIIYYLARAIEWDSTIGLHVVRMRKSERVSEWNR